MYFSARYYFRKKKESTCVISLKKESSCHHHVRKEFLSIIDSHLQSHINYKPSICYELFMDSYKDVIESEIIYLSNKNIHDIPNKIKKTFKNRYYLLTHHVNK
jgi:hypothetical protein